MTCCWPLVPFGEFLRPCLRPHLLAPDEDANLVGVRWYGEGPFHRELKLALRIAKKSHFTIRKGDIIYNKLFAWKGSFGIVSTELDNMFVSDKFPTYELDRNKIDESYLRWFFRWPPLWDQARSMSTGSAALSKLTLNPPKFLLLKMPCPHINEQRRISGALNSLADDKKQLEKLQQEDSIASNALLQAGLGNVFASLQCEGILGDILLSPPRNGWSTKCDNVEGGTAILRLGAVTGFQYRASEHKRTSSPVILGAHYWLQPGDLLITRSNTPDLVGHAAIYDGNPSPCIYPDLMMRLTPDTKRVDKRFIWYWLQSPLVREFIKKHAKGTSPTMKKISQSIVTAIPFPVGCSIDYQRQIVENLDLISATVRQLTVLQAERHCLGEALIPSVIDRAFKGAL